MIQQVIQLCKTKKSKEGKKELGGVGSTDAEEKETLQEEQDTEERDQQNNKGKRRTELPAGCKDRQNHLDESTTADSTVKDKTKDQERTENDGLRAAAAMENKKDADRNVQDDHKSNSQMLRPTTRKRIERK